MNKAEKIMMKKTALKAEMDKTLPREQSDALWNKATEKLSEILDRYSSLPKSMRMHTESRIFPSAALYLTLKEVLGQERAYRIIEDAAAEGCVGIQQKLSKLMKIPGMPGFFVKMWSPLVKKVFGPDNGFKNVFYQNKKGEYRMDITSCPYFRYSTELGCPEITKIFCENDDRIYGRLPGIRFERTGTLGKGADRCDFYLRKI